MQEKAARRMREIGYFGADAVASEAAHLWSKYSYDVFVPVSICDHQCAGMRTTLETLLAKGGRALRAGSFT